MVYIQPNTIKKLLFVLVLSGIYATVRYVIYGGVYWTHIPVYILNKTIAVASVIALFISATGHVRENRDISREWGVLSLHMAVLHVLLSLIILTPNYFMYWFSPDGKLNLLGELTSSAGALATYFYFMLVFSKNGTKAMAIYKLLVVLAVGAHIFIMGYEGWAAYDKWHGGMPPITIWSFIFTLGAGYIFIRHMNIQPHAEARAEK